MFTVQFILALTALANLSLALFLLWKTRRGQVGRGFAWYMLAVAAWTFCCALIVSPQLNAPATLWALRAAFCCGGVSCICWVLFCAYFPRPTPRFPRLAHLLVLLGLPWLLLCWTPLVIAGVEKPPWWATVHFGSWHHGFLIWFLVSSLAGIGHLALKSQQVRGLERVQARYVLFGTAVVFVMGALMNLVIPSVQHDTQFAYLGPASSLFMTSISTYAIVRYRLMDIRIVLREGLVYFVSIGVLAVSFALLVPVLDHAMQFVLHTQTRIGNFLVAFGLALAFDPLRRTVKNIVDHQINFPGVIDYRHTLRDTCDALAAAHQREALLETLARAVVTALELRAVAIYLPDHDEQLVYAHQTGAWPALPPHLPEDAEFTTLVLDADDILLTDQLVRQDPACVRMGQIWRGMGVEVALPLIAGGQLLGMVLLGEKESGDVFTGDDLGLLRILSKQAALALENARHYDEMVRLNEYHERLLQVMQDGMLALDAEGRILTFNAAAERITGVPASAALGQTLEAIGLAQLPTQETGRHPVETVLHIAGTAHPVLVSVTPFLRRWERRSSRLVVLRDISRLRALQQAKVETERLSSMGAMAASLAHEIKNPLVPIQVVAHLLPTRYDDAEFREELCSTMISATERIRRLVEQMENLVHEPTQQPGAVDLAELLTHLLELLRPECERQGVTVRADIPSDLPVITGIYGQLYQALLNVLTNSVQAMGGGGMLSVRLAPASEGITCIMRDTGPGVSPQALARIFEPLYTTREGGHGLGLALTYQFIRAHGGDVRAELPAGGGLQMVVTLPLQQEAVLAMSA